jgi:calcium-dependent protein kinase
LVEKQMASGTLKMDMNKKQSNSRRKYACKTVNTLSMKDDELIEFMNEIEILRDLDHPNIVQLFEVFKLKRKLWIITELCAGGDLTARAGDMSELEAAIVMEQILRAISFMHKRNICHRDIKLVSHNIICLISIDIEMLHHPYDSYSNVVSCVIGKCHVLRR